MTPRLTPEQVAQLVDLADSAAVDVAAYTLPRVTPSWDDERVGRMIGRDAIIAELLPLALADLATLSAKRVELDRSVAALTARVAELLTLINTPRTNEWFDAVRLEDAHQIERWGAEHDAGKRPEDWIALVVYLLGKATKAHYEDEVEKLLHHIISTSAALLNWHRNATGADTRMRPGVADRSTT